MQKGAVNRRFLNFLDQHVPFSLFVPFNLKRDDSVSSMNEQEVPEQFGRLELQGNRFSSTAIQISRSNFLHSQLPHRPFTKYRADC